MSHPIVSCHVNDTLNIAAHLMWGHDCGAAMSRGVVSARAKQTLYDVEQLMAHHQLRRIPVIDGEGRPIGLVSLNDIARESAQPDTKLKQGPQKVTHTLAAICRRRIAKGKAA